MKSLILIFLSIQLSFLSNGQIFCADLSSYDQNYLNNVSFDDITFPVGSAFMTSGDIQFVKPSPGNSYMDATGDTLIYIGNVDLDVSTSTCNEKILSFSCIYLVGLAVDGDTIFNSLNPPSIYAGNGFTFEWDGTENYIITGDFDVVSLYSSTNFLFDVCLDCNQPTSMECVDLSPYDQAYLNDVSFDDITYPVGSAFITSGDIQYIKPSTGNFYQGVWSDTLFYIGDIDIDVSTSTCNEKILYFSCVYLEGLAVDGDTIFSSLNPPATYSGNGFTFEFDGGQNYIITGDFDVVSLYSSTNFLFDVCLDCNQPASMECVDLSPYDQAYLNDVSFDDITYPVGSAFITSGDIRYIKPSTGNFYQGVWSDTLFYIGDIDIDVSASTCNEKILYFSCVYLEGLAVDGDTIFNSLNPPTTYAGNGFTFEYDGGQNYIITGDFDVVSLYSSTNFLFNVCLDCTDAVSITEIQKSSGEILVYPNPTSGIINIRTDSDGFFYRIYNTNGVILIFGDVHGSTTQTDISELPAGLYLVAIARKDGTTVMQKLFKSGE